MSTQKKDRQPDPDVMRIKSLLNEISEYQRKLAAKKMHYLLPGSVQAAKQKVYKTLLDCHGRKVAYGPFKGMKLASQIWGGFDVNAKILGTYERHIVDKLFSISRDGPRPFIDIGAADGFFAIGAIVSGIADKVYAFEISERGQKSMRKNALENSVLEKIHIRGDANFKTLSAIMSDHQRAIVLVDIEGGEFDLLDNRTLGLLSSCTIIIELHPLLIPSGPEEQTKLIERSKNFFNVDRLKTEFVPLEGFEELKNLPDDLRLLALSENRGFEME